MPTINEILGENKVISLWRDGKSKDEIRAIAKKERLRQLTNPTTREYLSKSDDIIPQIARGLVTNFERAASFGKGVAQTVTGDKIQSKAYDKLVNLSENFSQTKDEISQKNLTPERKVELEKLKTDSANAKGFVENAKAGINQLFDAATHPSEITTQGITEFLSAPENALGLGAGKFVAAGGSMLSRVVRSSVAGMFEGAVTSAPIEYEVAKGQGKDSEEAWKIAQQSLAPGILAGGAMGTVGGLTPKAKITYEKVKRKVENVTTAEKKLNDISILKNEDGTVSNTEQVNEKLHSAFKGDPIDEGVAYNIIKKELVKNNKEMIESIDQTEAQSNETIAKEKDAVLNSEDITKVTPEQIIEMANSIEPTKLEAGYIDIINDGVQVENRFSGTKLISRIETSIKNPTKTPDEIFVTLRKAGFKQDIAKVARQSYAEGNSDLLVDYMSNKLTKNLELNNETIKAKLVADTNAYNKRWIAEDTNWQKSMSKKGLDDFIDKNIDKDFIDTPQRDMLYELNKLGFVADLKHESIKDLGVYDKYGNIIINKDMPPIDKAQTLTHEYIHSATAKLVEINPVFKKDIESLMKSAKMQSKNKKQYGFTTADEFVAEAFSSPRFADELNSLTLSKEMKKRYGIAKHIQSVWDLVVAKFSEVVESATGKRFEIQKDSYLEALNARVAKEVGEFDSIKKEVNHGKDELQSSKGEGKKDILEAKDETKLDEGLHSDEAQKEKEDIKEGKLFHKLNDDEIMSTMDKIKSKEVKSLHLEPKADLLSLVTDFSKEIQTPIFKTRISLDKMLNHLSDKKEFDRRIEYINLVKPTLENPMFIIKDENRYKFFKTFVDNKDKTIKFLTVLEDENGNFLGITATPVKNTDIKNLLKKEVLWGGDTLSDMSTPQMMIKRKSDINSKIIPNKTKEGKLFRKLEENQTDIESKKENWFKTRTEKMKSLGGDKKPGKGVISKVDTFWENQYGRIDYFVDTIWEDVLMQAPEKILKYAKKGANLMGAKFDPEKKHFSVSENQKIANEATTDFRTAKAFIYEEASSLMDIISSLKEDDKISILRALNGDLQADALSAEIKPFYEKFRATIDDNANKLVEAGILDEKDKIEHYLKRYYKSYIDADKKGGGSLAYQKLMKRKDLSEEQRLELGMSQDASFVISSTIAEQNILLLKAKVLKELADKFAIDKPKDGYVYVNGEMAKSGLKRYGALADKYIPNDVKAEIDGARLLSENMRLIEDGLYPMIDHLKVNLTVKNPPTHIYNVASNVMLAGLNGDLTALGKVLHMAAKNPKEFKALVKKANRYGLNSQLDTMRKVQVQLSPDGKKADGVKSLWKNIYMAEGSKTGDGVRWLYEWEDKIFKVAAFKRLLDKGVDEKSAYKQAADVYVNYDTPLPGGIKVLDKSGLMPFLHYQYKATPATAKVILKHPIKFALFHAGVFALGGSVFNDTDYDEMSKPTWAENKLNLFGMKEWTKFGGNYINTGRMIPGTKFEFDLGGFVSSTYDIAYKGKTPLGYTIGTKYDSKVEKYGKRALTMAENFLPSMTLGRYAQRGAQIAVGDKDGYIKPRKNYYGEDMSAAELLGRSVGARQFNSKKEFEKRLKVAKRKYNHILKTSRKGIEKIEAKREYQKEVRNIKAAARKAGITLDAR